MNGLLTKKLKHLKKLFIISSLISGLIAPGLSEAVQFGNIVPGLSVINEPVQSVKSLKMTGIVHQSFDFSCGAAAIATLLQYGFHDKVTEADVLKGLITYGNQEKIKKYGFSFLDLKNYATAHHYYSAGYQLTLDQLSLLKVPGIVLMDIKGYKHFVVFKTLKNNQVYLADPVLGNRVISKEEFGKDWNNIVLVIMSSKFDTNSILVHPQDPLSAKPLFNVTNQNKVGGLEFGNFESNLF